MGIPLLQQVRVGAYVVKQRLMGVERYPLVLMLEPHTAQPFERLIDDSVETRAVLIADAVEWMIVRRRAVVDGELPLDLIQVSSIP